MLILRLHSPNRIRHRRWFDQFPEGVSQNDEDQGSNR
jgi:hypothetical protein